jgi:hypothetical protein
MRISLGVGAIFLVCLSATAIARASSGGPGAVYSDFAQDGTLSCTHSRADLKAVLSSGSLDQYGDPYTLTRLKLAVRRQLAGGCHRQAASASTAAAGLNTSSLTKSTPTGSKRRRASAAHEKASGGASTRSHRSAISAPPGKDGNRGFISARALIVGLLFGVLAVGGWLTRRALAKSA